MMVLNQYNNDTFNEIIFIVAFSSINYTYEDFN